MLSPLTRRLALPLSAVAVLALAGCASDEPTAGATADAGATGGSSAVELVNPGTLTVCTNPPYQPFEFTDEAGDVVGLDIDLVGEVAADLGVEAEIVISPFEGIESGQLLGTDACDVVASAITITEERQGKIDFSEPYFDADQGLLVPEGSDLTDVESLEGATVAVQQATTGETWAEENGLDVVQFEDLGLQVAALETGQVLEVGTCDVLASAITITEERQGKFDFSEPYFDADQGLLVPAGSDLSDVESLQGATVAVQQATTGEAWAEENGLTVVQFEDLGLQVAALESGQVDAVVNDFAVLQTFVEEGFEVAADFDTGEQYGLGVKKGNTALLEAVNATLDRVREDGTYDALYTEWIGVEPAEG